MLSKNKIKFFKSLKLRKFRLIHNLFIAEGEKIISELLQSKLQVKYIITSLPLSEFEFPIVKNVEIIETDIAGIKKISNFKTAPKVIGVFEIPENKIITGEINDTLSLFCDDIQNPGNLGTIIRTADWFGIKHVFCSENTADIYNPKVIQATMGAVASVKIYYVNSDNFFKSIDDSLPVYGTFLIGENIYKADLKAKGIIVIGNEGKGISEDVEKFITKRLFIPYGSKQKNTESLNASVAAGIVCSEFIRRK